MNHEEFSFHIAKLDSRSSHSQSPVFEILDENEIYISGLVGCDSLKLYAW
jgi:hypothetical protein